MQSAKALLPGPSLRERLAFGSEAGCWLFAAVALLSIAAQNVLFLGLACWLALSLVQTRRLPPLAPVFYWWLAFMAWTLMASVLSPNAAHSVDSWKRFGLVVAAWYAGGALTRRTALEGSLQSLLIFSSIWCMGASLVALWQPLLAKALGVPWDTVKELWITNGAWRAVSGSGGYMVLGTCSMLVLLFFTGVLVMDRSWRKLWVLICLGSVGLALFLTLTRSAWAGTMAGLLAMALWKRPRWGLGLIGIPLAGVLIFPGSPLAGRLRQGIDMKQDSTRERVYMAQAGLAMTKDHPLFGVGDSLESFERGGVKVEGAYRRYRPAAAAEGSLKEKEEGHLHNNFVTLAAQYGLPALGLALVFFFQLWRLAGAAVADLDPLTAGLGLGLWAALIGWWVNGMLEYNFCSFQSSFVLWFLTGIFLAGRHRPAVTGATFGA